MQDARPMVARVSAETAAYADLDEVCRWLIQRQLDPVRFEALDLPAIGQASRLRLALPITAPRAVLCALWLLEESEPGGCLLVGQLRFVARPIGPDVKLMFSGRTASAMGSGVLLRKANDAAQQLVRVIATSIGRPSPLYSPGVWPGAAINALN
jgi:hypothetical protein